MNDATEWKLEFPFLIILILMEVSAHWFNMWYGEYMHILAPVDQGKTVPGDKEDWKFPESVYNIQEYVLYQL